MPKRAAHKSSVQAHHPTATPSAFHAAEETPQYIQSNESTIGPGTSENNVEPLSPKESPLLSRFEQAALLEPPSTKRAGPVVLVQDSADEADVHVDDIIRSTTTMDGGWFELSCIDSCYATESSVSRVYQTNSDASVLIDNQVISASEDEGLFEQPFQWSKEYDDSILLSDSSSTSATELLFSHSEMSDGLEKIAEPPVAQETVEPRPSIIRSYPLRERTFQQRQPYTADKEWHARLIGSRKASRRSPSRDYLPDDVMLGELQDDEEDPDYEEHSSLAVDDTTIMAGDSLPRRPRPSRQPEVLDFSFHDLDDDDLPTIYELRRQFSIRSQASDTADEPKSRNIPQASPALRLMSALSARAKRKLVRLATQQVEPLESLETEPSMIPWTHDPSPSPRRPSSEDADDNMTQLQSNGGGLTLGASSNSNHRRHIQVSSSDDDEDKVLLAKTKKHKHRQHVLPTAFFKKNMLPDDASALKALRSKLKHSNAPESVARSESDHIQHAHHAKRRIDLSRRGDGYLDDFIAQLAQDKSDSEDEAQSSQQENSDGIEYFGTSPRPTPHDTILADSRKSLPKSYKRLNRRISESNDTGSSDLDRHTSISEHDLDFGWPGSGVEVMASTHMNNKGSLEVHRERLDMIDRMTVRPTHGSVSKPKRPSPASKKRRRSSGNHPSIKKRRPTHRKPRYIRTDAGSEKTNPDSARLDSSQGDFYGYWTKRHHEENGSDHNNDHNYDYDYDYDYDHDYNHDYDHDWPDHDDEPVVRNLARDNSLPTPRGQKPRRRKEDLGYPIRRYNTTEPRHQQRKISRATVVRNKPRPTFTRRSAVHQGPKLGQTGQQKLPAMRQRTLYSHFSSWYPQFPAPSRPQFVHKPVFKPVTSRAGIQPIPNRHLEIARGKAMKETGGYNDSEFVSDDYYAQDQDWESEAGFVASQAPSTGHGTLPPAPIVITQKAQDSKPTSFARQRKPNDIQEFSESDLRGSTTSNGVYFSRDTYIGRGILSRVLRAMSPQASEASNAQEHVSQVVFFGQLFAQDRHDIPAVQHALEGVILDFESRFRSIEETQSIHDPGYFRLGSLEHAQSEFTACLLALENMTILLIEYSTCAHHDFASFWTMFKTVAVDVLARLAEALPTARHHSMTSRLVLWTTWALLTWEILYDCIAQQDQQQRQQLGQQQEQQLEHQHEHQQEHQQELQQGQRQEKQQEQQQEQRKHNHIDGPIMKLFKQLLEVADASFLSRLLKSLNPPQASGAISGQDDLEIWVCLIQVLDQYAHLRDSSRSFWVYFNRQVLETWIAVNETPGDMIWLEQESHVWMLLQGMCMLHQFGKEGSSNTEIRTRDNWELISWILRKNWLERTPPDSYTTERQLRKLLIFCHSRIQTWNWTPCADIVSQIYRYFSKRNFRDMSSEPGYRLPEFLKHMIATPVKDSIQPEERLVDFPGTSGFQLDVSYTKTVDLEHDRCFEIFLKIATRAIRWQVCEIGGNKQDVEVLSTPTTTTVPQSDSMDESQSRVGKIRTCKRLLSSISPTIVFTISADGSSEQTYSSLCNTCNLVLVLALLVPDYIRLSTIGELRSLLNFDESDDASRKILLEAVFYLGVVWQRQVGWGHGIGQDGRSPEKVVDYLFGRLEFMCQIFEKDMNIMHAGSSHAHMKRKPPLNALIETTLGYIARLMTYARNMEIDRIPYPPLVFLDQRLSRLISPEVAYPPELRLQALGVIERVMAQRRAHSQQLVDLKSKQAQPDTGATIGATIEATASSKLRAEDALDEDDFSSLDFEQFDFDDSDLLEYSQPSQSNIPIPSTVCPPGNSQSSPRDAPSLPEDDDLLNILLTWVFPSLEDLLRTRHQALHDKHQQEGRPIVTTIWGNGSQSTHPSNGYAMSLKLSSITSISSQGAWRVLGVHADCSVILIDHGRRKMEEVVGLFKRESWLSPWIQHWKLQDELVWTTRMMENYPRVFQAYEDQFLRLWFSTIGIPQSELSTQHRFLHAILRSLGDIAGTTWMFGRELFRDLPIAHLDHPASRGPDPIPNAEDMDVDRSLMDTNLDAKLLHEFKEARLQLVAKVLCNIGEHYLTVSPSENASDRAYSHAYAVKSRYQNYLSLLLHQLKKDYERLESKKLVRDSIRHVELAHHTVGQVIQHCGLVMQSSQIAGPHDSILKFLTSSHHFPQPRMDGMYTHQRIRGYAYLYHAGEKGFFSELLVMVLSRLKVIPGWNDLRFKWPTDHPTKSLDCNIVQETSAGDTSLLALRELTIVDNGFKIYDHSDNKESSGVLPAVVPINHRTRPVPLGESAHISTANTRSWTGTNSTIPQLFGVQQERGAAGPGDSEASRRTTSDTISLESGANTTSIRTLLANQSSRQLSPQQHAEESLWTLTSSLRNVALESEDRTQWNTVMASFRTMALASIFRPLLTAFLGVESQGYCSTSLSAAGVPVQTHAASRSLPQRPSLMVVSVPAVQWLVSLVEAFSNDMDALGARSTTRLSTGTANHQEVSTLKALEGFQKETSILFASILQCLTGCRDLIDVRWTEMFRTRLSRTRSQDEGADRFLEENTVQSVALHLFGQVLRILEAIANATRKIKTEHGGFFERNISWREALFELIQYALDHGVALMMSFGGPLRDNSSQQVENVEVVEGVHGDPPDVGYPTELQGWESYTADRIPGAQDAVSMEASFQEFVPAHVQFAAFEKMTRRELQNLPSCENWSGNVLSSCLHAIGENKDGDTQAIPRNSLHQGEQWTQSDTSTPARYGLRKHQWALWSFQSSFFDYCGKIATLDARFHRQVQETLRTLLKSPQGSQEAPIMSLEQIERCDSVWYHILHHAINPLDATSSSADHPWVMARWCMGQEWRVFLAEWDDSGPSLCHSKAPDMPGLEDLFV